MGENLHRYRLCGLSIESEIPLPEIASAALDGPADLIVRIGSAEAPADAPPGLSVAGESALLVIESVGRFRMDAGRLMTVEPDPHGSERNVRLYLLGSAFAAILHQRRLLPIHANSIVINGRAVAFMGHPGAGKSTMAAWFHDRGFPILADDVCVVTFGSDGAPLAWPGIPRLRLWREALERSGRSAGDYEMSFDDMDKYNVPTSAAEGGPVPLDHLYLLEKAGPDEAAEPRALGGSAAVEALVANTYRGAYLPMMGLTGPHLFACARLAAAVPVFRAPRRWGLELLDEEGARLEAHARALIAASSRA